MRNLFLVVMIMISFNQVQASDVITPANHSCDELKIMVSQDYSSRIKRRKSLGMFRIKPIEVFSRKMIQMACREEVRYTTIVSIVNMFVKSSDKRKCHIGFICVESVNPKSLSGADMSDEDMRYDDLY